MRRNAFSSFLMLLSICIPARAQTEKTQPGETSSSSRPANHDTSSQAGGNDLPLSIVPSIFLRRLAEDQKDIWTSPIKTRIRDLEWLVPLAALTAGSIKTDTDISSRISTTSFLGRHSNTFANGGVTAFVAGAGGFYFIGKWEGNDHARETGILAGEAAIDSLVVDEVIKIATQRERPLDGTGQGRFWHGGSFDSSFPSEHAIAAWSIASVLAYEYPGPLTKVLAYSLATGVSVARVTGKEHFTSDALVGSTLGWLIGRHVYAKHHNPELLGERPEITPIFDQRTRAYGLHLEVVPTSLLETVRAWKNLAK
jgi:membrane-associated phospholipid phosphatase